MKSKTTWGKVKNWNDKEFYNQKYSEKKLRSYLIKIQYNLGDDWKTNSLSIKLTFEIKLSWT